MENFKKIVLIVFSVLIIVSIGLNIYYFSQQFMGKREFDMVKQKDREIDSLIQDKNYLRDVKNKELETLKNSKTNTIDSLARLVNNYEKEKQKRHENTTNKVKKVNSLNAGSSLDFFNDWTK